MKKKNFDIAKDQKDWESFIKNLENVQNKESYLAENNNHFNKIPKIDLHGFSLEEANNAVEQFLIKAATNGYKKFLVITGKGLRSKVYNDPYRSEKMSVLKNSVPEYIRNNENLSKKIKKISKADIKDGGDGAFYIFLK